MAGRTRTHKAVKATNMSEVLDAISSNADDVTIDFAVVNGLPPFEDASFENFGELSPDEKLALADRVEMGFTPAPLSDELRTKVIALLSEADELTADDADLDVNESELEPDREDDPIPFTQEQLEATVVEMVHK